MYLSVCRASATGRSLMKRSPTECDVCDCVCCASATGRSLIKRSPTECDVSVCDSETLITKRPKPTWAME